MKTAFPPRRHEFLSHEGVDSLQQIRVGVLATLDEQGQCEARPLNFCWLEGSLWFHTSPHSLLARRDCATFTGWHDEAWIPSYWRHPQQACPATTYYTSVVVRGRLQIELDLATKARVLQAFMAKYQPEGGHHPLQADHKLYSGPLQALTVMRMEIEDLSCKAKYGQHLSSEARQKVRNGLIGRGDWRTTSLMKRYNPDLQIPDGYTGDGGAMSAEAIWSLLQDTYWASQRDLEITERNRCKALSQWGYFQDGQLKAYLRLEGNWLYDVIVSPQLRGRGIGSELLTRALADPKVAELPRIGLDTRDGQDFYRRFGFQVIGRSPNGSWVMMRPGS
jgi:nitroimidazol reductase NimA-like FMN-containing flavoprotein (pyridoxamine 5'-phosphate oxidase superfamily)/GNAT superfamily N-acetyltransferase